MKSEAVGVLSCEAFGAAKLRWVIVGFPFALFYGPVFPRLVNDWSENPTFSYGFYVPIIAAYLVWRRWGEIRLTPVCADNWAALPLLLSIVLGLFGQAIGDTFSARVSMVFALASAVWLLFGRRILRALRFPIFYLLLMIPAPYVFIKDLAYYLRYIDAMYAANILQLLGIPVYREAYFLYLPNMTLEVADGCSGVSSILALFALGLVYAYFLPIRLTLKALLLIGTVPFAVAANLFRIVVTAILAYHFGSAVFQSSFHAFSGTFTFTLGLLMLLVAGEKLRKRYAEFSPVPRRRESTALPQGRSVAAGDWRPLCLGTAILVVGFFASQQLGKTHNLPARANFTTLASVGPFEVAGDRSAEASYNDINAESSLSQTFIAQDKQTINLFVGYRSDQTNGNRLHSPKMYHPDEWDFAWLKPAALPLDGATSILGQWMLARKGQGQARELILYWYQIGSRTYGGELEHRIAQIRRLFFERRSDGAIVRISTSLRNEEPIEAAQRRLREFAIRLYPEIVRILPL